MPPSALPARTAKSSPSCRRTPTTGRSEAGGASMAPGGRASTRQRTRNHRPGGVVQLPRQPVRLLYRPIEILAAEQVEAIHQTSLEILRDIGVNFLLPEARD